MQIHELIRQFTELYGDGGEIRVFFAPGRVNLIGDHTDYNGGHAFPCALTLGTYAVIRKRDDRKLLFSSCDLEKGEIRESSLDDLIFRKEEGWIGYPKGILWAFDVRGSKLPAGFEVLYAGNIPLRAGVSSSGAIECVTALAVREIFHLELNSVDLAVLAQRGESRFMNQPCSIIDHISSMLGREGCGLFLSAATMRVEYIPMTLGTVRFVITNSMIRYPNVDDVNNERKRECEKALKKVQIVTNVINLGDLSTDAFATCKDVIMDENLTRRVRHVVYENARTIKAVNALRVKDLKRFGKLMSESHESLKNDYEVSCPELDTLVGAAQEVPGVLGSRMTGAGLGGCTVSLVEESAIEAFEEHVTSVYEETYHMTPDFFIATAGDGAREMLFY
ncbi:MAG: galactokinase [Lachnospiraceae bacterium]|nr:galactokinase [Lachnospiraceae bacterium]